MPYPPDPLETDATNETALEDEHPQRHNDTAGAVNDIVAELGGGPSGESADVTARLTALDTTVAAKETPAGAQTKVDTHRDVAAPHAGHETPAGAQAKVDVEATARATADALLIPLTQKAAANGVATLGSDSKIPSAQLPPLAIGETFSVASQAAMLALTAQRGDVAIRTDLDPDGVFILTTDDPTQLANWVQITAPGAVLSVDGRSGTVSLSDLYDAAGAAAAAQAAAVQRANHTGTQAVATISDFAEAVQDTVGAMATDGTTVNFTYDDTAGTLTAEVQGLTSANLSDFAEAVRDRLGATLVAGTGVTVTVDDPGDTVTIATTITQYTDEMARDAIGTTLVAGNNIDITPDDGADTITIAVEALTSGDVGDFAEAVDDRVAALLVAGTNVTLTYNDGAGTLTIDATGGGGGVSDGDKGDITVSGTGTVWTVDNNVVTLAKLADMATARIIGRVTASSGDPEALTAAQVKTLLALAAADISDFASAVAATAVAKTVLDANSILYATTDDTPAALPVAASRIVGRKATGDIGALTAAEANAILAPRLHVRDEKASGTNGGTFTSGAWQVRTLNTVKTNEVSGASLATNELTLPAGTYEVTGFAQVGDASGVHQARLYDVTGAAVLLLGNNAYSGVAASSLSVVQGLITVSVTSAVRLEHRCTTTQSTNGFGRASSWGTEVYAELLLKKLA